MRAEWRATVELIDGFRYEIAGSVQFPTASQITKDLGLDTLPTVEPDVMSTNIGDHGEEPMIFYRDPMQLMTHLGEKHGFEAVTGMAELIGWSQGPAKALDASTSASRPRRSTRCMPARPTTPSAGRFTKCCSGRRWTSSTGICPTRTSTARHARDARISGHQFHLPRPIYPPAAPPAWRSHSRCPTAAPR